MQVYALINLYNDRQFLAATLESVGDFVDKIVVADGAYKLYYEEYQQYDAAAQPYSTDGSLEIVQTYRGKADTIILHNNRECWANQTEKRTALINAVPDGDWFIIIDADEMLMGDLQEGIEKIYESGCNVASTPIYAPGADVDRFMKEWHPRIFKKMGGMHYEGTHWHLRDKHGKIIEEKYPVFWTDKIVLIHFKVFKSQSRQIPHGNYMTELADRGFLEPTDLGRFMMSGIRKRLKEG